MSTIILYLVTVVLFLGLDALGLTYIVKPVFDRHIGALLAENIRYVPALVFYLFYVAGLLWFVSVPALRDDTPLGTVFLSAAFFGAVAYGTYEFSNYATLRDWHWQMVATDFIWGTLLTGTSATLGVWIMRRFA